MPSVLIDPGFEDRALLDALYGGEIVVYPHQPAVAELAAFARSMVEEAFLIRGDCLLHRGDERILGSAHQRVPVTLQGIKVRREVSAHR